MFEGARILLVSLLEIVHPVATIRLCDGGLFNWPARGAFSAIDPIYGTLGSVDPASESVGDEAPGGQFTLLPPSVAAAISLAQANAQGSPVRMWMAEANPETSALIGTPEQLFDGMIDTVTIRLSRGAAEVAIEYVSVAEKLFQIKEGNVLSDRFHQLAWSGETGFAQCTGSVTAVPWGVTGPPRGSIGGGGGSFTAGTVSGVGGIGGGLPF